MLYQNDKRWKDEPLNDSTETIGSVGCLVTSLCNINNIVNDNKITPPELNRKLILYNGYTDENYIIWSVVEHILGVEIIHNYTGKIEYSLNAFYIVNYLNPKIGHFTNLISKHGSSHIVFDVYSNQIRNKTDIRRVVRVCKAIL